MNCGFIATSSYPWAPPDLMIRSDLLIEIVKERVSSVSDGKVKARKSMFEGEVGEFSLGLFAAKDIARGEVVFDSIGPLSVSGKQMSTACYNCYRDLTFHLAKPTITTFPCCPSLTFCGGDCKSIADNYYHSSLCGKDFTDLYENYNTQRVW